ncbi:hypothetical protein [Fredinandcohnia sp. 179-A 10B2 NHS]|uniref:hypothetical protein n=1 Tax=Fredinandcohnia sp. 179-A 10B2 NHS TaxID=3235176 RepID=UPI0039A28206
MTNLVFDRENQFANKMRKYKIFLNDEEVGEIKNGEQKEIKVQPGSYKVKLKIDWCESKEIQINAVEGQTIQFQCGSRLRGLKVFQATKAMDKVDEFVYLDQVK